MSELVEFIMGCLDADEQTARAILDSDPMYESDTDVTKTYERLLRLLAQPYAGEPGWRDEWGTQ